MRAGAASTRVGNELGRGQPKRAARAAKTVIALELALMVVIVAVGFAVRDVWGYLFTDDPEVSPEGGAENPNRTVADLAASSHVVPMCV